MIDSQIPVHISARAINREWFDLPMSEVWGLMSEQLYFLNRAFQIKIYGFVLMRNHFHLLAGAPQENLSEGMSFFMRETSRQLARASTRINSTYGGRFFRSTLSSVHYFYNAYKYVYRNPVEAGACSLVEEYPWSTLRGLLGLDHLLIPIEHDSTLFSDVNGTLDWLNRAPERKDWEAVRKALRRRSFKLAKDRSSRRKNHLETDLL